MNQLPATDHAGAFRRVVDQLGEQALDMLPADERDTALARFHVSFREAVAAAKNPAMLYAAAGTSNGRASIARAVFLSAVTGLYPGGALPEVYLTPRRIQGSATILWSPSFRGLKRLAERGSGARLEVRLVYQGEPFAVLETAGGTDLRHEPDPFPAELRSLDDLRGAYVRAVFPTGPPAFAMISKSEILKRRAKSDSAKRGYGPWVDWPLEMAHKTALRYAVARSIVPADPILLEAYAAESADAIDVEHSPVRRLARTGSSALADALGATADGSQQIADSGEPLDLELEPRDAERVHADHDEGGATW